jgi:WD40 repeat protein
VEFLTFSHEGKTLATASADGTIGLWDSATGQLRIRLGGRATVQSVAFSPDGQSVAAAHNGNILRLWSVTGTV